jgi:hypothetical protein
MKCKFHFLIAVVAVFTFTACSPRIGTMVTKTYPPLENSEPVVVFMNAASVPSNNESLGVVSITDSGFSIQCDSLTVVEHLKSEARKAGGNAVVVTEYVKPSFFGSSCHQMTGTILRIADFDSETNTISAGTAQLASVQVIKPERKLSRITLAADFGYGWRTAPLSPDLGSFEREYYKGLMSGLIGDASFNYYFSDNMGVGLLYSAYNASQNMYGSMSDGYGSQEGSLKTTDRIDFLGPAFLMRFPLRSEKWIFNCSLGLGYLGYSSKTTFPNLLRKIQGSTFGESVAIGLEYKIEKNLAIGLSCSSIAGVLTSFTKEENGSKQSYTVENSKDGEGLGHIQFLLGLRYYLK